MPEENNGYLRCAFCGINYTDLKEDCIMVAAPMNVNAVVIAICSSCVGDCQTVMEFHKEKEKND